MVFQSYHFSWARNQTVGLLLLAIGGVTSAWANPQYFSDAQELYRQGQYFRAARYAFAAGQEATALRGEAHALTTLALIRAGLYQSASYFFIRTLQSGDQQAIRRVLTQTETLLLRVGPDLLRPFLIRYTKYEDYDLLNRSAYLYSLSKAALLLNDIPKAIDYLNAFQVASPLWPYALQIRATALAIQGRHEESLRDFRSCYSLADQALTIAEEGLARRTQEAEVSDLKSRCLAGEARVYYQAERFLDAELSYERIPKRSIVWPDVLFEMAWNAFARNEHNRTLGRLVTYKSPKLEFLHNTEIEVLRAQTFLSLCLYEDANQVLNEFNLKYSKLGEEVKRFVESNSNRLGVFYQLGRDTLYGSKNPKDPFQRLLNRFVRAPYFQSLVTAEKSLAAELQAIRQFASLAALGQPVDWKAGFPGFLDQVLGWRRNSILQHGGAFVKNSLMDYHSTLVADFEKMAFIKLEMLRSAKEKILARSLKKTEEEGRGRGSVTPSRRRNQYYWDFRGEFWADELGDYVFGLESQCQ